MYRVLRTQGSKVDLEVPLTKDLEWFAEVERLAVHVHVPLVILVSLQSHG